MIAADGNKIKNSLVGREKNIIKCAIFERKMYVWSSMMLNKFIQWKENCGKNDEKLKFQIFRAQFFIEQNRAKKLRGFTENIWGSKKENLLMM